MIFNYIEKKTEELLKANDLYNVPVAVNKLAKKIGIKIKAKDFDDDVSGIFVMKDDKPFIAYNSNQGLNRRRFTIAHELGHFILHSRNKPLFVDKKKEVMFRNSESSTGEHMKEREANAFAAAILMPKRLIEQEIENSDDADIIEGLARKFKVSTQAMSFRLSNLGYDFGMF